MFQGEEKGASTTARNLVIHLYMQHALMTGNCDSPAPVIYGNPTLVVALCRLITGKRGLNTGIPWHPMEKTWGKGAGNLMAS
jgi:hypothetical protein